MSHAIRRGSANGSATSASSGGADELATGRENLVLQGRLYGASLAEVNPRVDELADILDLAEFADRRVKTYSGGQRRRLDVALGIVHHPAVLFLDEPTTGLDPQNRANLWEHLSALRDLGTTIVLTTHYLEEADVLCDRIVIVDHGEIVAEGSPRELKRTCRWGRDRDHCQGPRGGERTRHGSTRRQVLRPRDLGRRQSSSASTSRTGDRRCRELLRVLDSEQIGIKSMSLSEPTLDDVFLRQTGRSLRDTGAGDGARQGTEVAA